MLAAVFSNASRSQARDRVDAVARRAGWQVPDWYVDLKATAVPILGTAAGDGGRGGRGRAHRHHGRGAAGRRRRHRTRAARRYRFGQPLFTGWLDRIGPRRAQEIASHAADAIGPIMQPYRPIVVFLAASTPA